MQNVLPNQAPGVIRVHAVVRDTIVDGPGMRLAVYMQGCPHHCPGCHNPQTHDPAGGTETTAEEILSLINPLHSGLTLSGGEPFLQAQALVPLARATRDKGLNIWLYTGYTWEELLGNEAHMALLRLADVLVDGRFDLAKRSLSLRFRGSANQRLIDVPASLAASAVVEKVM